jgi:hypothetical protein
VIDSPEDPIGSIKLISTSKNKELFNEEGSKNPAAAKYPTIPSLFAKKPSIFSKKEKEKEK